MPTWPQPDATQPEGVRLSGDLPVHVLERRSDGWAHVLCDNGWSAWTDGRLLSPLTAESPREPPAGPLVLAGVAAVIGGGFFPWVTGGGASMTAWEMPLQFLLGRENDLGGPKVGLLLLIALLALLPILTSRPWPWPVYASLAVLSVEAVFLTLMRVRALTVNPAIGVGAVITLVGGFLLAIEAWRSTQR